MLPRILNLTDVMKNFSSPVKPFPASRSCSLLKSVCGREGLCSYMATYTLLLPIGWLPENVATRRPTPLLDYEILSPVERKSRLLPDVSLQPYVLVRRLIEILSCVPKDSNTPKSRPTRDELFRTLKTFKTEFLDFPIPEVKELLETMEIPETYNSYLSSPGDSFPDIRPLPLPDKLPLTRVFRLLNVVFRIFLISATWMVSTISKHPRAPWTVARHLRGSNIRWIRLPGPFLAFSPMLMAVPDSVVG